MPAAFFVKNDSDIRWEVLFEPINILKYYKNSRFLAEAVL